MKTKFQYMFTGGNPIQLPIFPKTSQNEIMNIIRKNIFSRITGKIIPVATTNREKNSEKLAQAIENISVDATMSILHYAAKL